MKIIDEYSKQIENKSHEIEKLHKKIDDKKGKMDVFKKDKIDME